MKAPKLIAFVLLLPLIVSAQQDVLNNGIDTSVIPNKVRRQLVSPNGAIITNPASQSTALSAEVLLTTTCTTLSTLANRRSLGLQNCGPNDVTCTIGGADCAAAGKGIRVPALASGACGFFAMDLGPNVVVRCLTSALQATGSATIQIELGP